MKVLITGGAGFIGSHIADHLLGRGHEVAIVDNCSTGRREYVPTAARFYELDLRDSGLADVLKAERPDAICHHAAQMSVVHSLRDPYFDADNNILGGLNLLRAAVAVGVRQMVFASSGGTVYGEPVRLPAHEDDPTLPLSPYGVSKLTFEHYLRITPDLQTTCLRYANVYGPRQSSHGEAGVIAIFAEKMLRGEAPVIFGDGEQSRDFVYVSDVAAANVAALENGITGTYNIGTGQASTINQVTALLTQSTGFGGEIHHAAAKEGEVRHNVLDCTRARTALGWQASMGLAEGIAETVAWIRG